MTITSKENQNKKAAAPTGAAENDSERFLELKKMVYEMEIKNKDKLIFFKQREGWWWCAGKSAWKYKYGVSKTIAVSANLRRDESDYYRFTEGIVSIKEVRIEEIRSLMKIKKIIKDEKIEKDLWIFTLTENYSDETLKDFAKGEELRRKQLRAKIIPDCIMVKTEKQVRKMARLINNATTNKANKRVGYVEKLEAERMAKAVVELIHAVHKIAKGELSVEEGSKKLIEGIKNLEVEISTALNSNLLSIEDAEKIAVCIEDLNKAINDDMVAIKLKDAEK